MNVFPYRLRWWVENHPEALTGGLVAIVGLHYLGIYLGLTPFQSGLVGVTTATLLATGLKRYVRPPWKEDGISEANP